MKEDASLNIDDAVFADTARILKENSGVAFLELPLSAQEISATTFKLAREAFDAKILPRIPDGADSAHASGYHPPAGSNSMSRYNTYREGLVLSDNARLLDEKDTFQMSLDTMQSLLAYLGSKVLRSIARELALEEDWFERELSPTEDSSQWHLKRYVTDKCIEESGGNRMTQLLPSHTDPSLVSIVIHDRECRQPGGQGLRYNRVKSDGTREWVDFEGETGHGVAVVFVGSILSYITGNYFLASRHCVVHDPNVSYRMAATYFVRPSSSAILKVPPSPYLRDGKLKRACTFEEWNSRVARNYEKVKNDSYCKDKI